MAAQYPFAALVGMAVDRWGAWSCSLAAALFNALGFGLFARQVAQSPSDNVHPSPGAFYRLVLYFGMIGLATVCSYAFAPSWMHYPFIYASATGTSP